MQIFGWFHKKMRTQQGGNVLEQRNLVPPIKNGSAILFVQSLFPTCICKNVPRVWDIGTLRKGVTVCSVFSNQRVTAEAITEVQNFLRGSPALKNEMRLIHWSFTIMRWKVHIHTLSE